MLIFRRPSIYRYLKKFYNSKEIPVCGAISMILSKRYPDDWNLPRTVSLVREHHGIVHAVSSVDPSGGTPSNALYNLTSKTNGMSNFGTDDGFPRVSVNLLCSAI